MSPDTPQTGPRHEPERIYERAADPAEAANRPLEPKAPQHELYARDEPHPEDLDRDPHEQLNHAVTAPDPNADSDPYQPPSPDDDADHASGVRGSGHEGDG